MKNFEQILKNNFPPDWEWEYLDKKSELPYILMAMKEVHDQAVDMCIESVETTEEGYCNPDGWHEYTVIDYTTLEKVKDKLKING